MTLNYQLAEEADVTVRVFSDPGGMVRALLENESQSVGQHFVTWDGRSEAGAVVEDGQYRVEVYAGGPLRGTTKNALVTVDTLPPALQLANLTDGQRVGQEILTVQGTTEPDAVVWSSSEPQPLAVDYQGRFAFQRKLAEGSNLVEVRAVDPAGNTARVQREVVLVTAPPEATLVEPKDGLWTNQSILPVRGSAPPGATVYINDQAVAVNQDGEFRHELLLSEGENRIRLQATDDVGNITNLERVVYLKTLPPDIRLNVAEGVTVSDALLQVVGHTESGASVAVNGRVVPVSTLGDFQTSVFLVEGDNLIQVVARDQAGNTATLTRRVSMGAPQPLSGMGRLWRNFEALPAVVIPALLLGGILFTFLVLRQNQVSLFLSVDQNTFRPGLPGEDRVLELAMDLNKPARVTLEVLDANGAVQATLLKNRRRTARVHLFHWDGYDDYGRPVRPGDYMIRATAGMPPVKVTSAVQVAIIADEFVHRTLDRQTLGRRGLSDRSENGTLRRRE